MPVNITLNERNSKELRQLSKVAEEDWVQLIKIFGDVKPNPLRRSELNDLVSDVLNEEDAAVLLRQLLGFGKLQRDLDASSDEIIKAVEDAAKDAAWSSEEIEAWKGAAGQFQSLLDCDATHAVVKAVDLALDHQRLYQTARILTDIRPVFDDDRDNFLGAVVHNILRIKFFEGGGSKDVTFVLSEEDIFKLRDSCERALKKSKLARNLLGENCNVPSFSLDEEFDYDS